MLKKIYLELVSIRKELQAIRSSKEFMKTTAINKNKIAESVATGVESAVDFSITNGNTTVNNNKDAVSIQSEKINLEFDKRHQKSL